MANSAVLISLLWLDILALTRWFRRQTLGKIIIALLFISVFLFFSLFLYSSTISFLFPLTTYQVYGQLTALYLIHAAVIVTLWLGIGSALVSTYSFLVRPDQKLDFLLTLPINQLTLCLHFFFRTLFSSLAWSLVVFLPIGLAVLRLFGRGLNPLTALYLSLVIFFIVVGSTTIGSLLAFLLARFHRLVKPALYLPVISLLYILATLFLIRYLLPSDLARLVPASAVDFLPIFTNLPLNRLPLPTLPLTNLLLGVWSNSLYPFIAGLALLLVLTLVYTSRRLAAVRRLVASQPVISFFVTKPRRQFYNADFSLTAKDITTTVRNPADVGYGLFLLLLVLSFFIFLGSSIQATASQPRLQSIAVYGLVWLLFYSVAYLMRLIFPLMAREGSTAWFLFTKPVRPGKIINQKTLASLVLSSPLILVCFLIWPFLGDGRQLLTLSIVAVVLLTLTTSYLGHLFPNFAEGGNSERVSTSAMGLISILVLLFISYLMVTQPILASPANLAAFLVLAATFLVILKYFALLSLRHHQF